MKKLIQKIRHRLKSHSKKGFGIHSPFVFEFQQKVLYSQKSEEGVLASYGKEQDKVLRLVLRMCEYFDLQNILLLAESYHKGFDRYSVRYDVQSTPDKKYELVVVNASEGFNAVRLAKKAFVVLIGAREELLENALRHKCEVFLDLYEIAICVFNEGLSKQEFKLRL